MPAPMFIHITKTGDIWVGNNLDDNPPGVVAGVYRVYPSCSFQKIGTVSGTNPNISASTPTGKQGKEIS